MLTEWRTVAGRTSEGTEGVRPSPSPRVALSLTPPNPPTPPKTHIVSPSPPFSLPAHPFARGRGVHPLVACTAHGAVCVRAACCSRSLRCAAAASGHTRVDALPSASLPRRLNRSFLPLPPLSPLFSRRLHPLRLCCSSLSAPRPLLPPLSSLPLACLLLRCLLHTPCPPCCCLCSLLSCPLSTAVSSLLTPIGTLLSAPFSSPPLRFLAPAPVHPCRRHPRALSPAPAATTCGLVAGGRGAERHGGDTGAGMGSAKAVERGHEGRVPLGRGGRGQQRRGGRGVGAGGKRGAV